MLAAYFDESERTSKVFSVAGFAYRRADAKRCGREWVKLFRPYGGCHMTDLALRKRQFKGISAAEAGRLIQGAIEIINRRACFGVAVSCNVVEMSQLLPKWIDGFQGAYPVCCYLAMLMLGDQVKRAGSQERISYYFEAGHALQPEAQRFLSAVSSTPFLKEDHRYLSHGFASKKDVVQLQSADILAWEWAKYWDETAIQRKRTMRRSLAAILSSGSANPSEPNNERMKYTHLEGQRLREYAEKVKALGLLQLELERSGASLSRCRLGKATSSGIP